MKGQLYTVEWTHVRIYSSAGQNAGEEQAPRAGLMLLRLASLLTAGAAGGLDSSIVATVPAGDAPPLEECGVDGSGCRLTAKGWWPSECVHNVPSGAAVVALPPGQGVRVTYPNGTVELKPECAAAIPAASLQSLRHRRQQPPENSSGAVPVSSGQMGAYPITWEYGIDPKTAPMNSWSGTYSVGDFPKTGSGGSFWIGLEPYSCDSVMQAGERSAVLSADWSPSAVCPPIYRVCLCVPSHFQSPTSPTMAGSLPPRTAARVGTTSASAPRRSTPLLRVSTRPSKDLSRAWLACRRLTRTWLPPAPRMLPSSESDCASTLHAARLQLSSRRSKPARTLCSWTDFLGGMQDERLQQRRGFRQSPRLGQRHASPG